MSAVVVTKRKPTYRERTPLEQRKEEYSKIVAKYPTHIPVIVDNSPNDKVLPIIKHTKFLAGKDMTVGEFMTIIRKRVKLEPDQAMFLFINNTLPAMSKLMSEIQKDHADPVDSFVYFTATGESTFGCM